MPLVTLLSFLFVAFTIEVDNEAETRFQHKTTLLGGKKGGPWLVSSAMYWNCLRYVDEGGISIKELLARAKNTTNYHGMQRWGYVTYEGEGKDKIVRATPAGMRAKEVWQPLFLEVEGRWRQRFGEEAVGQLRLALSGLVDQFSYELPDGMPILGYGLRSTPGAVEARTGKGDSSKCSLDALLAKVLLAYTLLFEKESKVSLPICLNILRLTKGGEAVVKDIPDQAGVSKEGVSMGLTFLRNIGCGSVETSGGFKVLTLTHEGQEVAREYSRKLRAIEKRWSERFGEEALRQLEKSAAAIAGDGTPGGSRLFEGLQPQPGNWRIKVKAPKTLPHCPMVLHRGGYPDGS